MFQSTSGDHFGIRVELRNVEYGYAKYFRIVLSVHQEWRMKLGNFLRFTVGISEWHRTRRQPYFLEDVDMVEKLLMLFFRMDCNGLLAVDKRRSMKKRQRDTTSSDGTA